MNMENLIDSNETRLNECHIQKEEENQPNSSDIQTGDYYFANGFQKMELKDYEGATKMFEIGAKLNHLLCQKYYAKSLISGRGIKKNDDEGWKLLLKSAFDGDWDCECTFNEMDPKILKHNGFEEAWEYIIRASKNNIEH